MPASAIDANCGFASSGGFGDIEKAAAVFVANELEPLQETLSEFNDMIGQEVIRFAPFGLSQPRS